MGRRLFTIVSAISLLLCLLTAALWVRSYWITEDVGWTTATGATAICSSAGSFMIYRDYLHGPVVPKVSRPFGWTHHTGRSVVRFPLRLGGSRIWEWGAFALEINHPGPFDFWLVAIPDWALTLLLAALPLGWLAAFRRLRRRRRLKLNLCPACGYDLRASPNRCPECGEPVEENGIQRHRVTEEMRDQKI